MITDTNADGYHHVTNTFEIHGEKFHTFFGELSIASIVSPETFAKCLETELHLLRSQILALYKIERAKTIGN